MKHQLSEKQARKLLLMNTPKKNSSLYIYFKSYWQLYLLLALPILYFIIFKYLPMYGIVISFQDYNMFKGILGSQWVGFDIFKEIFAMRDFAKVVRNTFVLNVLDIIVGFPAPIILAILLNEVRVNWFKKTSQTILYFPHFISWVIIGSMMLQLFGNTGIINNVVKSLGYSEIPFLTDKWHWLAVYIGVGVWQNAGWGTIIYLAAISGVGAEQFEAADIDGAGRFRKIFNILIPNIKPTIITLLILTIGKLAAIGFDRPFVMGNTYVLDFSEVISTYVYKVGLQAGRFNVATAVGLFQSVVGVVILLGAEFTTRKLGERGIW